jgi:hypothetical protein
MASHIYLAKDSNDLICHCECDQALITIPPQLDCPCCGCGWLFSCIECRKAFTFARGIRVDESWEDLARRDITSKWKKKPARRDVTNWVAAMKELLADVEVGGRYVCLDWTVIPVEAAAIRFDGLHSHHDLDYVPQVAALKKRSIVKNVLSNIEYWQNSALERD